MPLNRRWTVLAGCVLAALAVSGPARAASSGVHVDPNSPPGKEYAIPLLTARGGSGGAATTPPAKTGQAAGGQVSGTGQPAANSALFGAGITRPAPAARHPATARHRVTTPTAAVPTPPSTVVNRRLAGTGGGGSTAVFWILAGLALLIPGVAVGFGVRRWRHA